MRCIEKTRLAVNITKKGRTFEYKEMLKKMYFCHDVV